MRWFVPHHDKMFDHVIVVDYASTDHTVDIIRELAPNWEVRQSRNDCFRAADVDAEVMDIERGLDGWKIALTATEFLCGDINAMAERLAIQGSAAAQVCPVAMVDMKERSHANIDMPLDTQCHFGYVGGWISPYKSRLFHRHADGAYNIGRHSTRHENVTWHPENTLLKWYGFAPWTPELKSRKLGIQARIPADEIALGHGYQHIVDDTKLNLMWESEKAISADLHEISDYF